METRLSKLQHQQLIVALYGLYGRSIDGTLRVAAPSHRFLRGHQTACARAWRWPRRCSMTEFPLAVRGHPRGSW